MNEIYVTVTGRVVATPESRVTKGGVPFAAFRLASTVRRLNAQTREYEDAATNFVNVTAFRSLGANVANSLEKGDPVVVYGRMRVNQWMRQDNTPATSVEIDAYTVGHDLSWGTTSLRRVVRAQVDQSDRLADEEVQAVHAELEGDAPGGATSRGPGGPPKGLDPRTDPYVVQAEPSGFVPREGGPQELATV